MSSSSTFSLDNLPPCEQLCYVHCNICDTLLAVSVPCSSFFKTVTVRCGHCTNLLPVSMEGLLLPSPNQPLLPHTFFSPSQTLLQEEILSSNPNFLINQTNLKDFAFPAPGGLNEVPRPRAPVMNRAPEKRQRVPSAYNRFIKDEIQRIKAENPDISHREAFSTAAKNWAHFPHIHFGLMPHHATNVRQQEGGGVMIGDGFFGSANLGVSPY